MNAMSRALLGLSLFATASLGGGVASAAGRVVQPDPVLTAGLPAIAEPGLTVLPLMAAAPDTQEVRLPSGFSFREQWRVLGALRPRQEVMRGEQDPAVADGVARLEIDGLVIDETVTKIGRDFYDVFHSEWVAPEGIYNYTIRIQEYPVPTLGTRVVLLLNDEPLFQLQLEPRYEVVEDLARQAARFTGQELERRSPRAGVEAAGDPGGEAGAP
jgi:curli production assembly/transport component CsgE